MLFIRHWNFTLFLSPFDFWGCLYVIMNAELWIINLVVLKIGGIFKKQWKNFPSASAEAQSKGIIFLFAYWEFLIAFINSWCHRMSWQSQSQFAVEICLVTAWHRLLWKQLPLCVVANEKWYSCWLFWFCGCLIGIQTEEVSAQKKVVMKMKRHLQKQWKHYRFN